MRVLRAIMGNSLSYMFAYRADVVMRILVGVGWSFVSIAILELLFLHTGDFNGWSKGEMILILISLEIGINVGNIIGNYIESLESNIRLGFFDVVITKPIDSQFLSLFGRPDFTGFLYVPATLVPYMIALSSYDVTIQWKMLPLYILLLVNANIMWLSLKTILMTINFWKQKLENLKDIMNTLWEFGRFPPSIFPKPIRIIIHTIFPLAFMGTVPAEVLKGEPSWFLVGGSFVVAGFFLAGSRLFWKKAIQNYSSASS